MLISLHFFGMKENGTCEKEVLFNIMDNSNDVVAAIDEFTYIKKDDAVSALDDFFNEENDDWDILWSKSSFCVIWFIWNDNEE